MLTVPCTLRRCCCRNINIKGKYHGKKCRMIFLSAAAKVGDKVSLLVKWPRASSVPHLIPSTSRAVLPFPFFGSSRLSHGHPSFTDRPRQRHPRLRATPWPSRGERHGFLQPAFPTQGLSWAAVAAGPATPLLACLSRCY